MIKPILTVKQEEVCHEKAGTGVTNHGSAVDGGLRGLETRIEEPPIANAATKADHETLATYYELKAKELTNKAEGHRHKARVYGAFPYGSPKSAVTFDQHYSAVASRLEDAAQESRALAKQHREQAAAAQKWGASPSILEWNGWSALGMMIRGRDALP